MKQFIVLLILSSFVLSYQRSTLLETKHLAISGYFKCKSDVLFAAKIVAKQHVMKLFSLKNIEKYILVNQSFIFEFDSSFTRTYELEIYDRCQVPCNNCEIKTTLDLKNTMKIKSKEINKLYKRIIINSYEKLHLGKNNDGMDSTLICAISKNELKKMSLSKFVSHKNTTHATMDLSNFKCPDMQH